jgi:glycosyltransferase involved in cell wall biosynthesis
MPVRHIAIVTNFIYPELLGGTEIYCQQLAEALLAQGNRVSWIIPNFNQAATTKELRENGLQVIRFANARPDGTTDLSFVVHSFLQTCKEAEMDVLHFQEFGGPEGIHPSMLKEARAAGFGVVVTLHLVHYICRAGTMRYGSWEPCSGKLIPNRCGSCILFSEATSSRLTNYWITRFFHFQFKLIQRFHLPVPRKVSQTMDQFTSRLPFIQQLKEDAHVVVSLTQWFRNVLIQNGIPEDKIVYLSQVTPKFPAAAPVDRKGFVFVGRINHEKGIELLYAAARLLEKEPDIFIDLYGPVQSTIGNAKDFIQQMGDRPNIRYKGVLEPAAVLSVINQYQAVLLPSLVAEMAPLTIMDANALRIPVLASNVPGSVELIQQYQCGLIFEYGNAVDLAKKILQVQHEQTNFAFIQPAERSFSDVAIQYNQIYNRAS